VTVPVILVTLAMTQEPPQEQASRDGAGPVVAAVSRQVVGIYADYYGRGPTKAKTIWRDDVVVCILENVFTRPEQLLVDGGRSDQVRLNRQALQDQIEPLFIGIVEEATGRPVTACFSQVNRNGVAAEIFLLGAAVGDPAEPPA
jgi:uncharacterized protein YbcI